jgi:pilus assembly protein Flp/PilA
MCAPHHRLAFAPADGTDERNTSMIQQQLEFVRAWMITRFDVDSERGATAVEYGMMVALIAAVIAAAVVVIGTRVNIGFGKVRDNLPTS